MRLQLNVLNDHLRKRMKNARRYDVNCRALKKKKFVQINSPKAEHDEKRDVDLPKNEFESSFIKESSVNSEELGKPSL